MMRFKILLASTLILSGFTFSQELSNADAKSILEKIAKNYIQENYSLSYSKKTFESIKDESPFDENEGVFYVGEENQYRIEEKGTLVIQNNDFSLAVDSVSASVYISKVDKDFLPVDITGLKDESLMKEYIFELKKTSKKWLLTVSNKTELSNRMVLELEPNTLMVRKFTYYFPVANYFSETLDDETVEAPYMVVAYQKIKKQNFESSLFSHDDWVIKNETTLELKREKSNFELQDLRIESHL